MRADIWLMINSLFSSDILISVMEQRSNRADNSVTVDSFEFDRLNWWELKGVLFDFDLSDVNWLGWSKFDEDVDGVNSSVTTIFWFDKDDEVWLAGDDKDNDTGLIDVVWLVDVKFGSDLKLFSPVECKIA